MSWNAPSESPNLPDESPPPPTAYRGAASDPIFGFLLAIALSIGLAPMLPENADFRYTVAWLALAIVGVLAWLLGTMERIGREKPENLIWGVGLGALLAVPLLAFGSDMMSTAAFLMFPDLTVGSVMAYIIFVMPLAETLFFRGILQQQYAFWIVGLLSTLWNIILFFPVMWGELLGSPLVGLVLAIILTMMNLMYSYVRRRNGLAAAWLCQIVVTLIVILIPFL